MLIILAISGCDRFSNQYNQQLADCDMTTESLGPSGVLYKLKLPDESIPASNSISVYSVSDTASLKLPVTVNNRLCFAVDRDKHKTIIVQSGELGVLSRISDEKSSWVETLVLNRLDESDFQLLCTNRIASSWTEATPTFLHLPATINWPGVLSELVLKHTNSEQEIHLAAPLSWRWNEHRQIDPVVGSVEVPDGHYSVRLHVRDWSGRIVVSRESCSFTVDGTPPVMNIDNEPIVLKPKDRLALEQVPGSLVRFCLLDSQWSEVCDHLDDFSFFAEPLEIPVGEEKIIAIYYEDAAGNQTPVVHKSIILDTTPPEVKASFTNIGLEQFPRFITKFNTEYSLLISYADDTASRDELQANSLCQVEFTDPAGELISSPKLARCSSEFCLGQDLGLPTRCQDELKFTVLNEETLLNSRMRVTISTHDQVGRETKKTLSVWYLRDAIYEWNAFENTVGLDFLERTGLTPPNEPVYGMTFTETDAWMALKYRIVSMDRQFPFHQSFQYQRWYTDIEGIVFDDHGNIWMDVRTPGFATGGFETVFFSTKEEKFYDSSRINLIDTNVKLSPGRIIAFDQDLRWLAFNGSKLVDVNLPPLDDTPYCLIEASPQTLVACGTLGLTRLDRSLPDTMWRSDPEDIILANQEIRFLLKDPSSTLWAATRSGEVFSISPGTTWKLALDIEGELTGLNATSTGDIWVAMRDGALWYRLSSENEFHHLVAKDIGKPFNEINTINVDANDKVWLGTNRGSMKRDGCDWFSLTPDTVDWFPDGFSMNSKADLPISIIQSPEDGVVWMAFSGGGMVQISEDSRKIYDTNKGLSELTLNAISLSPDKGLLVGTDAGVFRYDPNTDRFVVDGLPLEKIKKLIFDPITGKPIAVNADGKTWTWALDGWTDFAPTLPEEAQSMLFVTSVEVESRSQFLFCDNNHPVLIDSATSKVQRLPQLTESTPCQSATFSSWNQTLVAGTSEGWFRLVSPDHWTSISSLTDSKYAFIGGDDKRMWFLSGTGSQSHLIEVDDQQILRHGGVFNDFIFAYGPYQISHDNSHRVWVGLPNGIGIENPLCQIRKRR